MNTMKWLIKREMWENKGMLVWTPAVIAGLIFALVLVSIMLGHGVNFQPQIDGMAINQVTIEGKMRVEIVHGLSQAYLAAAMPVVMVLSLIVFFYCLGALHDERRDRSLLFWKSLPVSDLQTVLSKVLLALVVAPLITIGIGLVLSLVILVIACLVLLSHGTNLFGELLMAPELYLSPLRLVGLLPVYILWALPTVGWLLLVSSLARSKVFLWAVGVPVISALLLMWAEKVLQLPLNAPWYLVNIAYRSLLGVIPGAWMLFENISTHGDKTELVSSIFSSAWGTLAGIRVWLGTVAGVAMIAASVWVRRRREEA